MKETKIKLEVMYEHLPFLFGKRHYIYSIGKHKISLILFYNFNRWVWELLGGKFKDPEQFSSKKKAEEAIRERYGIRKE